VSESRVDAVRRAMDEGRYHVDPQRVADTDGVVRVTF